MKTSLEKGGDYLVESLWTTVGTTGSGAGDGDLWIEISGGEGIETWRYSGGINRGS